MTSPPQHLVSPHRNPCWASIISVVAAAIAITCATSVSAQTADNPSSSTADSSYRSASALTSWLETECRAARQPLDLSKHEIRYSVTWGELPTDSEVAGLRREVEGKPDHPKRQELLEAETALRQGLSVNLYRVWLARPDAWRVARQFSRASDLTKYSSFADAGRFSDSLWSMTDRQVNVVAAGSPPAGFDYEQFEEQSDVARTLLFGTLAHDAASTPIFSDVIIEGAVWKVMYRTPSGYSQHFSGEWDPLGTPAVSVSTLVSSPWTPDEVGATFTFGKPETIEGFHRRAYSSVTERSKHGKIRKVTTLSGIEPFSPADIQGIAQVPRPGVPDYVRGLVKVSSVNDLRPGHDTHTDFDDSGHFLRAGALSDLAGTASRRTWLQTAGWVILGCLVFIMIYARAVHARSHRRSISRSEP